MEEDGVNVVVVEYVLEVFAVEGDVVFSIEIELWTDEAILDPVNKDVEALEDLVCGAVDALDVLAVVVTLVTADGLFTPADVVV